MNDDTIRFIALVKTLNSLTLDLLTGESSIIDFEEDDGHITFTISGGATITLRNTGEELHELETVVPEDAR